MLGWTVNREARRLELRDARGQIVAFYATPASDLSGLPQNAQYDEPPADLKAALDAYFGGDETQAQPLATYYTAQNQALAKAQQQAQTPAQGAGAIGTAGTAPAAPTGQGGTTPMSREISDLSATLDVIQNAVNIDDARHKIEQREAASRKAWEAQGLTFPGLSTAQRTPTQQGTAGDTIAQAQAETQPTEAMLQDPDFVRLYNRIGSIAAANEILARTRELDALDTRFKDWAADREKGMGFEAAQKDVRSFQEQEAGLDDAILREQMRAMPMQEKINAVTGQPVSEGPNATPGSVRVKMPDGSYQYVSETKAPFYEKWAGAQQKADEALRLYRPKEWEAVSRDRRIKAIDRAEKETGQTFGNREEDELLTGIPIPDYEHGGRIPEFAQGGQFGQSYGPTGAQTRGPQQGSPVGTSYGGYPGGYASGSAHALVGAIPAATGSQGQGPGYQRVGAAGQGGGSPDVASAIAQIRSGVAEARQRLEQSYAQAVEQQQQTRADIERDFVNARDRLMAQAQVRATEFQAQAQAAVGRNPFITPFYGGVADVNQNPKTPLAPPRYVGAA